MTDALTKRLLSRAKHWAAEIKKEAERATGKPRHIKVSSHASLQNGVIGILSTGASVKKDARAYEYGSGIHSRVKKRSPHQLPDGRILIAPKNKKVLAFFWEKLTDPPGTYYPNSQKLIKIDDEGKALFRYVEHPGVKAANGGRGYLSPAIAKVRAKMRAEIPKEVRASVIGQFRKKFK